MEALLKKVQSVSIGKKKYKLIPDDMWDSLVCAYEDQREDTEAAQSKDFQKKINKEIKSIQSTSAIVFSLADIKKKYSL